ncbi:protein SphX [Nitrosomonas stercoris]|uniref:Phosphate-binding protein n=2 Tax=Nitrosomonas TaxID=914 RepID=A0A4Y1YML7_9PROT|nr:protein SphX [Nitrosomonas stercoris]
MLKLSSIKIIGLVLSVLFGTINTAYAVPIIKIDGSSTVFPITEAIAEDFQITKKGAAKVTVGISGTGGGFKKFCRGEIDITNASRPILKEEMDACEATRVQYVEMPIAYDALTIVVNPKNDWVKTITTAELKKIWEPDAHRKIISWNQVNPAWPDRPINLYGPGADSGTFDYFTEAIVGKTKSSRGDYTASEDDNVLVKGVENDENALGYFGFAYYNENQKKLRALAVDGGKGAIVPSINTVENGRYRPLSRPIFIYVNIESAEKPEVKAFIEFYMRNALSLVREVKYFPLPAQAYTINLEHLNKKKTGTVFNGKPGIGLQIEELLKP